MKRTTISLPDDLAAALSREARRKDRSASAVARDALARYLGFEGDEGPRDLPFANLGHSGHHDTARQMETLLAREWDVDAGRR